MTDINTSTTQVDEDDDLFEAAVETFPGKKDLRDRLVVIYPNGKHGQRRSEATGKPYDWYETTTVVLDDGPNGWQESVLDDDGDPTPNAVPSVAENGPQVLVDFQWSAGGYTSRLKAKLPKADGKPGSVLGRVNSRKNKNKGMNASWSISSPTEEDMKVARSFTAQCKEARDAIVAAHEAQQNEAAFD